MLVSVMKRSKLWNGIEATGFPFEMKVAEELEKAGWGFLIDFPVSVLPDPPNLPVEETSIDFKACQESLFALIEARRAAYCEWILFRRISTRDFFVLSHHEDAQRRPGFQFNLRQSPSKGGRNWLHSQSLVRFQTDQGVYSDVISVNSKGESKDGGEDQHRNKSEIRKGARQASAATISAINDDYAFMEKADSGVTSPGFGFLYLPVIVTAAKISVLNLLPDQITDQGTIPKIDEISRSEVPWAIYRWSLPRSLWLPVFHPQSVVSNHSLLDRHRKLDVFIVSLVHLKKFLEEMKDITE